MRILSCVPGVRALAALCLAALCLSPGLAFAHAFLIRAVPPAGARLVAPPPRLTLIYTEAVVPHFCQVAVHGPGGAAVPAGRAHAVPGHPAELSVRLPHLAPGHYTVTWHAIATDAHRTEGRFGFTVAGGKP